MSDMKLPSEKRPFSSGRLARNRKFIIQNLLVLLVICGLWTVSLCTGLLSREGPRFLRGSGQTAEDSLSDQEQAALLMSQTKDVTFAGLQCPVPDGWSEKNSSADAVCYYGDDCALSISRPGQELQLPPSASVTDPGIRNRLLDQIEGRFSSYAGLDLESCSWQDKAAVRIHIHDAQVPSADQTVCTDLLLVDTRQGILCLELDSRGREECGRLLFEEISARTVFQ